MRKNARPAARTPGFRAALLVGAWVLSVPGGAATCTPYIEEHPSGTTASLRPHSTAFLDCQVTEAGYRELVIQWLQSRPPTAPAIRSLYLGRAIAYPWISRYLADAALQSPDWAARVAQARPGEREWLAVPLLRDPLLLQRLAAPFAATAYQVVGVSFEKVLFGRADAYSSSRAAGAVKVPFDAQLWLRLEPRP